MQARGAADLTAPRIPPGWARKPSTPRLKFMILGVWGLTWTEKITKIIQKLLQNGGQSDTWGLFLSPWASFLSPGGHFGGLGAHVGPQNRNPRSVSPILDHVGLHFGVILVTFGLKNRRKNQCRFRTHQKSPSGPKKSQCLPSRTPQIINFSFVLLRFRENHICSP